MNITEKLFSLTPPDTIFHYTNQDGLLGIIRSDHLWSTKIQYLNDSSEFTHSLQLIDRILHEKLSVERIKRKKEKIQCLIDNVNTIYQLNICVFSFSEVDDLLSMWRAYGDAAGSYSIGFNAVNIKEIAQDNQFDLAKVIYDEKKQIEILTQLIDETLEKDFNTEKSIVNIEKRTVSVLHTGGDFTKNLAIVAPILKHKSFYEEKEWRLIATKAINVKNMSFRSGKSMLIPFYKIKLGNKEKYLQSLTIGPCPNPELSLNAAKSLISSFEISQIVQVNNSVIPFRTW